MDGELSVSDMFDMLSKGKVTLQEFDAWCDNRDVLAFQSGVDQAQSEGF